jgi:peroxiredoxin Q/BCP
MRYVLVDGKEATGGIIMKKQITALLLTLLMTGSLYADAAVGEKAPAIEAKNQDGNVWKLSDHLNKKYLVVYFYPAAMTGGCTKQACSYRDYLQDGGEAFEFVGFSGDPVENLNYFQQAEQLNFTLLSDPDGAIAKAYGVPVREGEKSIKRTVDGKDVTLNRTSTASRWTFVIDQQGKVLYRDDKVKATADLSNILEFIESTAK